LVFEVTLKGQPDAAVQVNYKTLSKTARPGEDYEEQSGTLTFQEGEFKKLIKIPVLADVLPEDLVEKMQVQLFHPLHAVLEKDIGEGTIFDNDGVNKKK